MFSDVSPITSKSFMNFGSLEDHVWDFWSWNDGKSIENLKWVKAHLSAEVHPITVRPGHRKPHAPVALQSPPVTAPLRSAPMPPATTVATASCPTWHRRYSSRHYHFFCVNASSSSRSAVMLASHWATQLYHAQATAATPGAAALVTAHVGFVPMPLPRWFNCQSARFTACHHHEAASPSTAALRPSLAPLQPPWVSRRRSAPLWPTSQCHQPLVRASAAVGEPFQWSSFLTNPQNWITVPPWSCGCSPHSPHRWQAGADRAAAAMGAIPCFGMGCQLRNRLAQYLGESASRPPCEF
jgi:hypothetical protein